MPPARSAPSHQSSDSDGRFYLLTGQLGGGAWEVQVLEHEPSKDKWTHFYHVSFSGSRSLTRQSFVLVAVLVRPVLPV